jgi:transcriptional regulator with XRE-family HTH domain
MSRLFWDVSIFDDGRVPDHFFGTIQMSLLPIYLRTLRKRHQLSQPELALLLSLTSGGLSKIENSSRSPGVRVVLGAEVVFGEASRDLFPALYRSVEEQVRSQGRLLYERLEAQGDAAAREKLALLVAMIERLQADHSQP